MAGWAWVPLEAISSAAAADVSDWERKEREEEEEEWEVKGEKAERNRGRMVVDDGRQTRTESERDPKSKFDR